MTRIKVMTMVDGIGTYGGGESLARQIAQRLDRERFESTFCVTRWEPLAEYEPALEELRAAGVEFIGLERDSRLDLGAWRRLRGEIRERRIDVLHTHKLGSNFWGAILARRAGVPVLVAQEHGVSTERPLLRRILDSRLIARRADAFVAVCEADRQRMITDEKVPAAKTRVIENGIAASPARPGAEVRAELGIAAGVPLVGAIATLRPEKAVDVLIRASARLVESFPELRVVVVGGPDWTQPEVKGELEALVAELSLESVVSFLGLRHDVPDLIAGFDVGVLCSHREAGPLAVMEYMEAAKPVVATRVGGIPEIVEEGVTGLLVEPRDPVALADALGALLADPERRARMGEAGRERRRARFDISHTVARFEDLYEELVAAKL